LLVDQIEIGKAACASLTSNSAASVDELVGGRHRIVASGEDIARPVFAELRILSWNRPRYRRPVRFFGLKSGFDFGPAFMKFKRNRTASAAGSRLG